MTQQKGYGSHDKAEDKVEEPVASTQPALPKTMPTQDAWRLVQGALNSCRLATPPLVVDGIPGPLTLAAAKGLVPLIQHAQSTTSA